MNIKITNNNLKSNDPPYYDLSEYSNITSLDMNITKPQNDDIFVPNNEQINYLFSNLNPNIRAIKCKNIWSDIFSDMVLRRFSQLQKVDVTQCGVTDLGLMELSENLTYINLTACKNITDDGLVHFSKLVNLTSINFTSCNKITSNGMMHLLGLTQLTNLNITSCVNVKDPGMEYLVNMMKLNTIKLGSIGITNIGLSFLSHLVNLTEVDIRDGKSFTDSGLIHLANLSNLKILDCHGCRKLTNTALSFISGLVSLERVNLSICDITDAGLVHLSPLINLKTLDLYGCRNITKGAISHLTNMVNFAELKISPNNLK
jgi:hypothetical protein